VRGRKGEFGKNRPVKAFKIYKSFGGLVIALIRDFWGVVICEDEGLSRKLFGILVT
jgi:hypothetical protein